jgi:CIC family chloride channel protein
MRHPSLQPNATPGVPGFSARFWLLVVLTGVGTGLGGAALMALLRAVQHLAWAYHGGDFLDATARAAPGRRVLVLAFAGALAGLGRLWLRRATGGHGGELSEAIWFHSGQLPALRTFARAVLSIVTVALGAALGREGALKQTGAALASKVSDWGRLSPGQRRLLAACGAGAGVAVAYNVPFGGALFSLEVLLGSLALPLVLPALATSLIATTVSWLFLPMGPTYHIASERFSVPEIAWAVLAAPVMGLASVAYVKVIAWADARKPGGWRLAVTPLLALTALGFVSIAFPQVLGNGKDVVQQALTASLGMGLLGALLPLRLLATAGCLGSGAPGGLFTPTVTYGALLGGLLGHFGARFWPGLPVGSCALLGAGAVLAATTQGPVSAVALTLELTQRVDARMVPLLLAVAVALLVARAFDDRSIYSARIRVGEPAPVVGGEAAGRMFCGRPLQKAAVVPAAARHPVVLERLLGLAARSEPLYVVDEHCRLVGQISGADGPAAPDEFGDPWETATASDLAEPVQALTSSMTPVEVDQRFRQMGARRLPLVDPGSGRLLGAVANSRDSA